MKSDHGGSEVGHKGQPYLKISSGDKFRDHEGWYVPNGANLSPNGLGLLSGIPNG